MERKANHDRRRLALGEPTPGITEPKFCRDPLGTEGEVTAGPDDFNPFDGPPAEGREVAATTDRDPTDGDDPFAFDDVAEDMDDAGGRRPQLDLGFGGSWL